MEKVKAHNTAKTTNSTQRITASLRTSPRRMLLFRGWSFIALETHGYASFSSEISVMLHLSISFDLCFAVMQMHETIVCLSRQKARTAENCLSEEQYGISMYNHYSGMLDLWILPLSSQRQVFQRAVQFHEPWNQKNVPHYYSICCKQFIFQLLCPRKL